MPDLSLDLSRRMLLSDCMYEQRAGASGYEKAVTGRNQKQAGVLSLADSTMKSTKTTAVVELAGGRNSDDAHWQNLLSYCVHGNLQPVFDEYEYLLTSIMDRTGTLFQQIHKQLAETMNIRTKLNAIDFFPDFQKRMEGKKKQQMNIRSLFAVAFRKAY